MGDEMRPTKAEQAERARAAIRRAIDCAAEVNLITDEEERAADLALGWLLLACLADGSVAQPAAPPAGTVPVWVADEKRIEAARVPLYYAIEDALGSGATSRKVHDLVYAIQNMIRAYLPEEREVEARGEKDDG